MNNEARAASVQFVSANPVDVAIIGAGAVGCSVAAHLAAIGISSAVIEKEDIAYGASGNSTGLAHAGLRYLAQGKFLYVFRESRERQRLEALAPHWVRPFHFVYPVFRGDAFPFWMVRAGTKIYDAMARLQARWIHARPPRAAGALSPEEVHKQIPSLDTRGLAGATEYFVDAQLQDSRFTLGLAQQAHERGSHVITHANVRAVANSGALTELACVDRLNGGGFSVNARMVINASGAWIDELRGLNAARGEDAVEPSQGIHLVIDRVAEIPLIFASPDAGRVFFVLPYGRDASLIGTTDTPYHGAADKARPHRGEVKELLATLFRFFPALRSDDFEKTRVRDLYWGLRPLVHHRQPSPSASREHLIVHDSAAWWSIVGVKLTAARAVGEEVALAIHKALKKQTLSKIDLPPLPGGEFQDYEKERGLIVGQLAATGLDADIAASLWNVYGRRAVDVAALAAQAPALRQRVLPDEPWIDAQVVFAARQELALRLDDVLWRRTKWAHYRDLPENVVGRIAGLLGDALGWPENRRADEVTAYRKTLRSHRLPLETQPI